MICFGCREEGHIERDCPNAVFDTDATSSWCGFCDERTRTVDNGGTVRPVSRCQQCHPNRHKQLRQHRKCPSCHVTVYEWDQAPCGDHAGPDVPDRRPPREAIRNLLEPRDDAA